MTAVLQVALDMMHLKRALAIGKEAVKGGADWIEVGTPLLKSEGAEAVRAMRRAFPNTTIVADMKTMDVGAFEVEIAVKAGADVVTVMGLADDATISESVLTARRYGAKVMVDLMNVPDKKARARRSAELGAGYICLHVGIDEQMHGRSSPMDVVRDVIRSVSIPVAVAGGINQSNARDFVKAGASIVIVGGAIIKAEDVRSAAREVKKAMTSGRSSAKAVSKKYGMEELYAAFSKVSTPNIADAQHKRGVMDDIHPHLAHGKRMVGRALTVQTASGDWAKPVEAIDRAKEGDVIVIDAGGSKVAVWGELASISAKLKGVRGVVIDGAARDIETILDIDFPCFSKLVAPHAGEPKGYGGIGHEIVCGGQVVRSGDWVVGDENGVIVVPQESAVEIANRAVDVYERENRIREEIRRGGTLSSVQELEKWEQVR
ncbi:MAG: orotidine 5'-phosphate decarboxylase [Methanomassiliicoccales archaeon]|nr:orotidine 5'-phosphate decarboxylase [Methanomassiliicoccales archaeon]